MRNSRMKKMTGELLVRKCRKWVRTSMKRIAWKGGWSDEVVVVVTTVG